MFVMARVDAGIQAGQAHRAFWVEKKGDGKPGSMPFFPGWIDNPVGGRFQLVVGESLQHIAHIHHDLVRQRGDRHPLLLSGQDLQTVGGGSHQQSDQVDIFVLLGPDLIRGSVRDDPKVGR